MLQLGFTVVPVNRGEEKGVSADVPRGRHAGHLRINVLHLLFVRIFGKAKRIEFTNGCQASRKTTSKGTLVCQRKSNQGVGQMVKYAIDLPMVVIFPVFLLPGVQYSE